LTLPKRSFDLFCQEPVNANTGVFTGGVASAILTFQIGGRNMMAKKVYAMPVLDRISTIEQQLPKLPVGQQEYNSRHYRWVVELLKIAKSQHREIQRLKGKK
tara:strand:- start:780 stop:1085 length:306 start_codon:yes stop_codon:yes gene_type:complete